MASSHGVPRVAGDGDVEREKVQIRDYRALVDSVNAKVWRPPQPTTPSPHIVNIVRD